MGDLSGLSVALLARLAETPAPVQEMSLPPGVKQDSQGYYREKEILSSDGGTRIKRRPVALTWEEAKARHMDYYNPQHGWILEGYKRESDRTPQEIMADSSIASPDPSLVGKD